MPPGWLALCYHLSSAPYSSFHVVLGQLFFLLCLGCLSTFLTWLGWSILKNELIENGETKMPFGSSAKDGMKKTVLSPYTQLPFYSQERTLKQTPWECRWVNSSFAWDARPLASGLLFAAAVPIHIYTVVPLVQVAGQSGRSVPLPGTFLGVQHADLSITRLRACPWPKTSPMHWDSSNSRSLRTDSSKTNVSHSTSKNCIKPEETMLFLQVCFKSTQIFFWSQSYNSVKLDTILESPRKH